MTLKTYAIDSTFGIKRCKIPRFLFLFFFVNFSLALYYVYYLNAWNSRRITCRVWHHDAWLACGCVTDSKVSWPTMLSLLSGKKLALQLFPKVSAVSRLRYFSSLYTSTPQCFIMEGAAQHMCQPSISNAFAAESLSTISLPQSIDLSTYFFNFWHGQVSENLSTPLERAPLT